MSTDAASIGRPTVAIIGSFRQHWPEVVRALETFEAAGIRVVAPVNSRIRKDSGYVLFDTDPADAIPHVVQEQALDRILSADFVYLVAPGGYVGRTTLLEFGHVRECRIPTFFSARPADLPEVEIRPDAIVEAGELARRVLKDAEGALATGHVMRARNRSSPSSDFRLLHPSPTR